MSIFLKLVQSYLTKLSDEAIYKSRTREDSYANQAANLFSSTWSMFSSSKSKDDAPIVGVNADLASLKRELIKEFETWINQVDDATCVAEIAQAMEEGNEHPLRFHIDAMTNEQALAMKGNPSLYSAEITGSDKSKTIKHYRLKCGQDEIIKHMILEGIKGFTLRNAKLSTEHNGSDGKTGKLLDSTSNFVEALYQELSDVTNGDICVLNMPYDESNPTCNYSYHAAWYLCDVLFDHFIMKDKKTSDPYLTNDKCEEVSRNTKTLFGSLDPAEIGAAEFNKKNASIICTTIDLILARNKLLATDSSTTIGCGAITGSILGLNLSFKPSSGRLQIIMQQAQGTNNLILEKPVVKAEEKKTNPIVVVDPAPPKKDDKKKDEVVVKVTPPDTDNEQDDEEETPDDSFDSQGTIVKTV